MHTVRICVDWHNHIHATTPAPRKPSVAAMRRAIKTKLEQNREV